jgi:hypothetical protein
MPQRNGLFRRSPAILVAACSGAAGAAHVAGEEAMQRLPRVFPGAAVHLEQGRVQMVYGVPMTAGATAREAAERWITEHAGVFGCGELQLVEVWWTPTHDGRHTVFTYQQVIGAAPVEYGMLKMLVLNGETPRVVMASGTLAAAPAGGFAAAAVDGEAAMAPIKALAAWRSMTRWSTPRLVVWQGDGDWVDPVLAWKFTGENPDPAAALCRTFFVDAATGKLVASRNEVVHADITGTVQGWGTPGVLPDVAANPPVLQGMPNIRVTVAGGNSAFANAGGAFVVPHAGTAPVNVSAGVATSAGAGEWVNINTGVTTNLTASLMGVLPPGPANLLLNPTPTEHTTAQINGFIGITLTHNYFRDRAPNFTAIDHAIRCNTSVLGSCNANFSAGSSPPETSTINMYRAGSTCPNMSYSTILSHEYGHFVVNRLGRPQGAFGEGFGDMTGSMVWDDHVSGRWVYGPGTVGRDPIASNIQYPCSQGIHTCGMVLSGVWWRIRTNMGNVMGSELGLEMTRDLNVSWALITMGGPSSSNAAGPGTAIEVLMVDDDDGIIGNGTPNATRICAAFAAHNIPCPTMTPWCYINCDASTSAPVLNVADFSCFLSKFAAGDGYANCDGSTVQPVLNVADFACFMGKFAAGCP